MFFLSIFRENLHPFCELKILYYLCIPFRTQNAAASNQVVFSDGLHVMSLPEGICERVVIGSQARLRIWCLRAYGFESLRSHIIKRSRSVPRSLFLRLLEESWRTTRLSSNYKTQIRRPLSGRTLTKKHHKSTPWIDRRPRRGLSPEGERKRLSPFRPLARFLEIEECSPVSFFSPA